MKISHALFTLLCLTAFLPLQAADAAQRPEHGQLHQGSESRPSPDSRQPASPSRQKPDRAPDETPDEGSTRKPESTPDRGETGAGGFVPPGGVQRPPPDPGPDSGPDSGPDYGYGEMPYPAAVPAYTPSGGTFSGYRNPGLGQNEIAPEPASPADDPDDMEPGEVLVLHADREQLPAFDQQLPQLGMRVIRRHNLTGLGWVESAIGLPAGMSVNEGVRQLEGHFPDLLLDANHRLYLQQSSSVGPGARSRSAVLEQIGWPGSEQCGEGLRLGLIDGMVDVTQPVFRGSSLDTRRILPAHINLSPSPHGTAIAALLIGQRRGEFVGLAPRAVLFSAGVMRGDSLEDSDTTAEWVLLALDWLLQKQVRVINISLGGARNRLLSSAFSAAMDRNVLLVASAGNGGPRAPPVYPAAQAGVIAVTAVDLNNRIFRNANQGSYIDFSAPGVDVWIAGGHSGRYYTGTSYATPFVSVAAALWGPGILRQRALDLGEPGRDPVFGNGLLQAGGLACSREVFN